MNTYISVATTEGILDLKTTAGWAAGEHATDGGTH
jgi:hypothetical protein